MTKLFLVFTTLILFSVGCKNDGHTRSAKEQQLDEHIAFKSLKKRQDISRQVKENQEKFERSISEAKRNDKSTGLDKESYIHLSQKELKTAIEDVSQIFNKLNGRLDSIGISDVSESYTTVGGPNDYEHFTIYSLEVSLVEKIEMGSGELSNTTPIVMGEFKFTLDKEFYFIPRFWTNEDRKEPDLIPKIRYLNKAGEILIGDLTLSQSGLGSIYFRVN